MRRLRSLPLPAVRQPTSPHSSLPLHPSTHTFSRHPPRPRRREAAGAGTNEERKIGPFVEEWLQILGRNRGWWDESIREGPPPAEKTAGFKNFGNTCFFSSTLQCVMHSHIGAAAEYGSGPLAQKTRELHARYWSGRESDRRGYQGRRMINPTPLWRELKESGMFGRYDDSSMEDSATMLLGTRPV